VDDHGTRLEFDVRLENQRGETVAGGTASGYATGAGGR
jgi:hypothetical protein